MEALTKLESCKCLLILVLLGLVFLLPGIYAQEDLPEDKIIPEALRRPDRSEAPRYPQDLLIGVLGQGNAPREAYLLAQRLMDALLRANTGAQVITESRPVLREDMIEEIRSIRPRTYRLGGGRKEPDGCISFLVRFLGSEESITGELFLRQAEPLTPDSEETERPWLLDDLILEEKRSLAEIRDSYRYNFSPYERFF